MSEVKSDKKSRELLPCPFCAAAAEIDYEAGNDSVHCTNVECFAHNVYFPSHGWNRRQVTAATAIEALRWIKNRAEDESPRGPEHVIREILAHAKRALNE